MNRPLGAAAPGPPRTTSTLMLTQGWSKNPPATQHSCSHVGDYTLDTLPGARRGAGTPAYTTHDVPEEPEPPATAMDTTLDLLVQRDRESTSPPLKRRRTARPPPEPPPRASTLATGPTRHTPPQATQNPSRPMDPPGGRGSRMTLCHQPPCPGGRLCRIPGLAEMHDGGGSLLVPIATPLCFILLCRTYLLAF